MMDIALSSKTTDLLGIAGVQHDTAQALQGAASDANTTNVLDIVTFALYKTGTCTHGDNNSLIHPTLEAGAKTIGNKLIGLASRQSIDGFIDIR